MMTREGDERSSARHSAARFRRLRTLLLVVTAASSTVIAATPTLIGHVVPDCTLENLDSGQAVSLQAFRGRVVYVDFWASWCAPCLRSFPFMDNLQTSFSDRGLTVVAINVDEHPADALRFLHAHPVHFASARDGGMRCPINFGVQGMPTSFLIDRLGRVRSVQQGFHGEGAAAFRRQIDQLLAEPAQTGESGGRSQDQR